MRQKAEPARAGGDDMIRDRNCDDLNFSDNSQPEELQAEISEDGMRTYPCENCDKIFTDPSNLQRHIRSQHVGARCHACANCGKTFATSSGLKQHQHIHSSVKPFQCEVCLKAYTQFSNLCRHKRMHADCRQQIKCKDCGQAFSTMTSLSKHKRFCEGILRSGAARFSLPGAPPEVKQSPVLSPTHPAAALTAYMNLYGPRPPFPFYPPPGLGFPMFPPGNPLASGLHAGMMHDKLSTSMSPKSPSSPGSSTGIPNSTGTEMKPEKDMSDMSDLSSGSDLETTGSDMDSESGSDRIRKFSKLGRRSTPNGITVPLAESTPKSEKPPSRSDDSAACDLSVGTKDSKKSASDSPTSDGPFDLSRSVGSSSGDQPLDLSVKVKAEATPNSTPRKTHIFGDESNAKKVQPSTRLASPEPPHPPPQQQPPKAVLMEPVPEKKPLHFAYPGMPNPLIMEQLFRASADKEKFHQMAQLQQDAARMMAFGPRIPMPNPAFPGMGMSFMARGDMKLMPPMLGKLDAFQYNPGVNKLKERYSCKFCGKIFPRSANLTRHLRTHTGEQPYKCKYCERSFSISSNLQRHVRNIHNKEKPFKCPLCDRCFGQQTNLDRHLKKHETEGPHVADSPPPAGLEDRDESYFDEIRNFIGKATDGIGPKKDYDAAIDANFSITAQIGKQNQLSEKRAAAAEDNKLAEKRGYDADGEDEGDAKRHRLDNNNFDDAEVAKTMNSIVNGYHSDEDNVDDDDDDDGGGDDDVENDQDRRENLKSPIHMVTPLACST